jgi:hypothetical protein
MHMHPILPFATPDQTKSYDDECSHKSISSYLCFKCSGTNLSRVLGRRCHFQNLEQGREGLISYQGLSESYLTLQLMTNSYGLANRNKSWGLHF